MTDGLFKKLPLEQQAAALAFDGNPDFGPPMNNLTQALDELRRVTPLSSPWEAGDIGMGSAPVDYHIATILNAALSGDLTPRADADLAVALMVEKAVSAVVQALWPVLGGNHTEAEEWHNIAEAVQAAIRALAPASALAELQALRDERDAIATARDMMGNLWVKEKDRAEAAEADITTYQKIVADMTQEAEAAEAELAATQAKLARVVEALSLAANRLLRCSVDYDAGTKKFIEVAEWAKEARAELTTLEGAKP